MDNPIHTHNKLVRNYLDLKEYEARIISAHLKTNTIEGLVDKLRHNRQMLDKQQLFDNYDI